MPPDSGKKPNEEHEADFRMEFVEEKEAKGPADAGALTAESEVLQLVSLEPPKRFKGRLFSLKNNTTKKNVPKFMGATGRSFNYEQMYDEDAYGEEAFPDARVWRVYNDETQLFDLERIEAWRDAIDVLLVFIGLFAAVVSAFLIETSKSLQPDYAQITVITTFAILRSLNSSVLPHSSFSPDLLDPRFGEATKENSVVNALWYTSLTISLSTALLAMLIKQWLHQYMTSTSGNSRERARMRQFRYAGLQKYRVPFIIDLLPTLLHLALALFLAGLSLYLQALHTVMFRLVLGISAVPYTFYFVSIIIPLIDTQCPYKSPPSFYIYRVYKALPLLLHHVWQKLAKTSRSASRAVHLYIRRVAHLEGYDSDEEWSLDLAWGNGTVSTTNTTQYSLNEAERFAVSERGNQLDIDGIVDLCRTSSNTNVRNIALEAFGGLPPSDANITAVDTIINTDLFVAIKACVDVEEMYTNFPALGMERRHDRLIRAFCLRKDIRVDIPYILCTQEPYPRETDPCKIFGRWIVPWCGLNWSQCADFAELFTFCSHRSFTLSIWATLIRLIKVHQPNNPFTRVVLIAPFHLRPDSSEVGIVTFGRAMQHPFIRSMAKDYLGTSNGDDILTQSIVSATSLLAEVSDCPSSDDDDVQELGVTFDRLCPADPPSIPRIPHLLSTTLPPLLRSIVLQVRQDSRRLGSSHSDKLHSLLTSLFTSRHIDSMSWETLSCALEVGNVPFDDNIRTVFPPSIIHSLLGQFRHRGHFKEEHAEMIRNVARHFRAIFRRYYLSSPFSQAPPDFYEALFSSVQSLDLLSVETEPRFKTSALGLFWSVGMCKELVSRTCAIHNRRETGHLTPWEEYIHAPKRLSFISSQLVAKYEDVLQQLCRIYPSHLNWLKVFKTLLSLFHDRTYLRSMVDEDDQKILQPRKQLSNGLLKMKEVLNDDHPLLSNPEFDIPQIDDEDNLILSSPTADPTIHVVTPPLRSVDSTPDANKYAGQSTPSSCTAEPILGPVIQAPQLLDTESDPSRQFVPSPESNPLDPSSLVPSTAGQPVEDSFLESNAPTMRCRSAPAEAERRQDVTPDDAAQHTSVDLVGAVVPVNAAGFSLQDSSPAHDALDPAKQSVESQAEMGVADVVNDRQSGS